MRKLLLLILFLGFLSVTGWLKRTLVTDLNESEAREVAVALYSGGVRPEVKKEISKRDTEPKFRVDIRGGDRTQIEAWRILQEHGLPRSREKGIDQVYSDSQLIPTASEDRARFLLATCGELERTIKSMPNVVGARVHVVMPEAASVLMAGAKPKATASVLAKYTAGTSEPAEGEIKALLSRGVQDLSPDDIAVVLKKMELPSRNTRDEWQAVFVPTPGLWLDYAEYGAILAFGLIVLFRFGPPLWNRLLSFPETSRQIRGWFEKFKTKPAEDAGRNPA